MSGLAVPAPLDKRRCSGSHRSLWDRAPPGDREGGDVISYVRRFDHVGITVADLDAATQFFIALGLEIEGRAFVEGQFIDSVIGIPDSRTET